MTSKWMSKQTLLVTLLSSSLLISACGGSDSNPSANVTPPEPAVVVSTSAYANAAIQPLTAYSQVVRYKMPGVNNKTVEANTVVLLPKGTKPAGGWPIVVWAHGTTGVADSCAPSKLPDFASAETGINTNALISAFLQKGYAVVAPDYEGLGVEGIHPYLNLKSEAYSLIYALKAAREVVGGTSKNWVVVGHSQGGQAALGAAQYEQLANLNFKGTVAVAPASQFLSVLAGGGAKAGELFAAGKIEDAVKLLATQNTYAALAAAGIRAGDSGFKYDQIFTASSAPIATTYAENICAPTLGLAFGQSILQYLGTGGVFANYGLKADFSQVAEVSNFLQKAEPGTVKLSKPVLLIQGDADTTVPVQATLGLHIKMAALGTNVTYLNKAGATHTGALDSSVPDIVDFVSKRFAAS